ncbi:CENP-B protein 1 like [Verticillium longisporum]|uniref:CENP-B protein 1 like n=1 Tax=Verticillium longisporum TaxID=100787 RepID=A0A8I2Z8A9_VERLO|nr:CENP-B protein 1 like [Verticillium longisporum]
MADQPMASAPDAHDVNAGPVVHDTHDGLEHDHDHDHDHGHEHDHDHETHEAHDVHDVHQVADTSIASTAGGTPAKERHSLTLDQRRALRRWANAQTNRPSHKTCSEWFYAQYGQHISQSTVSHSLSPKYSRLDGDNPQLSGSRLRFGNWPDVEKLVLLWYQQVQASGRQPTNEELGEKAKSIFAQLPRYKDEQPPEFSPGWIHRFKKRYGLLVRRQRRHGDGSLSPAEDINYLADCVPRFLAISADTSPAAIKESVLRVVGVEATLQVCALVRDEILRRAQNPNAGLPSGTASPQLALPPAPHPHNTHPTDPNLVPAPTGNGADTTMYGTGDEDPEVVLQNALRQLQQEEADAEASAAVAREEREQRERAQGTAAAALATPAMHRVSAGPGGGGGSNSTPGGAARYTPVPGSGPPLHGPHGEDLTLTPIKSDEPVSSHDRPVRCPFCVNQRMLRTIKEAVEHLSTHVIV